MCNFPFNFFPLWAEIGGKGQLLEKPERDSINSSVWTIYKRERESIWTSQLFFLKKKEKEKKLRFSLKSIYIWTEARTNIPKAQGNLNRYCCWFIVDAHLPKARVHHGCLQQFLNFYWFLLLRFPTGEEQHNMENWIIWKNGFNKPSRQYEWVQV